ncbi:MAG: type II secretion system F family protein [Syntrophomonadaceae bacterium]|nr:type II secretion system F family protein [Syntrophomonadaceae bacterium]
MQYLYRARDYGGNLSSGIIDAEDQSAALRRLTEQGNYPFILRSRPPRRTVSLDLSSRRIDSQQRLIFTRQLSTMLHAGLPLLYGVETLCLQIKDAQLTAALTEVVRELKNGGEFWRALSLHPRCFPAVYIGMVRAGEHSGQLDTALSRLSGWLEREQQLRHKIRNAAVYPTILAFFTAAIVIAILLGVMPLFDNLFLAAGSEMPPLTRALIAAGEFIRRQAWLLVWLLLFLVIGIRVLRRTPAGRYRSDRMGLKLPLIGTARIQLETARFAYTLGTLLQAGLPLLTALEITADTVENSVCAQCIHKAREAVSSGSSLAASLADADIFSPLLTVVMAAGEESGELGPLLLTGAADLEKEALAAVDALLAALEPLLIIIAAIIVGTIIIAVLLPVFDLAGLML